MADEQGAIPEGRKLNGFRCHNCKIVAWTVKSAAPKRCNVCRCRDFSAVYPSRVDPILPTGMKEWLGDEEAPSDWGEPYLLRSGAMFRPGHNHAGPNWTASTADIIAYTPAADRLTDTGDAMRAAIDAGLRAFCADTEDFDMSAGMRRAAADFIMGQPGMFATPKPPVDAGAITGERLFRAFMAGDVSRLTTTALPEEWPHMQASYRDAWNDLAAAIRNLPEAGEPM